MKSFVYSAAVLAIATSAAYGQSQPVQWRVEDGGNGHWYRVDTTTRSWTNSRNMAAALGGHLVTISSAAENGFVSSLSIQAGADRPWLGGFQDLAASDYSEPAGGWRWVTEEPWSYTHWCPNEPSNVFNEHYLHLGQTTTACWNDLPDTGIEGTGLLGAVIEWSADCNQDGIVDYGQILSGQLADFNSNGIPDTCELGRCPGDINGNGQVNGVDLAAVLGAWGTNGQGEGDADVNNDGIVNGQDLAFVLGSWGQCPFTVPGWAAPIEFLPDPAVVTNPTLRAAITATGLPWRVRDIATQIELVLIPPGSFMMGCSASEQFGCDNDELPLHQVTLTNAFYISRHEITQSKWTQLMGSNPSFFRGFADSPQRPVENVSWQSVQQFLSVTSMRLPTEAEWEYAYRAGTSTAFHGWSDAPGGTNADALVGTIGWFVYNSSGHTHPVGLKRPNGFGLFDMSGNVWEFMSDWYSPSYYSVSPSSNPTGPTTGSTRAIRGGNWFYDSAYCRSSNRFEVHPEAIYDSLGFRVARNP